MPRLIDANGAELANPWQLLPREATVEDALACACSHLLVNAGLWSVHKEALAATGKAVAVWLDSDQNADLIAESLPVMELVALNFPTFMDGRAYSTAVVLRTHHAFKGEIRAIGDVLRDMLYHMKRCGFSTFDLRDSVKLEDARKAFSDFTTNYQSTVAEPVPLFKRRA